MSHLSPFKLGEHLSLIHQRCSKANESASDSTEETAIAGQNHTMNIWKVFPVETEAVIFVSTSKSEAVIFVLFEAIRVKFEI